MNHILIEKYTPDEILDIPDEILNALVLTGEPLVFKAGSADILGAFRISKEKLVIELAQIDGGGEGVLPTLWILANRFAVQRSLSEVEWIVHAVNCAKPNLKLRRILVRRGFVVENVKGVEAYHLIQRIH